METMTAPDLSTTIAQLKEATESARHHLLNTFAYVPDDKLGWSPSSTARSAVHIVSHCGMANQAFAMVIRGEELPVMGTPEEASEMIRNAGRNITTREEAVKLVEDTTDEVLRALETITPDRLDTNPNSPFGPMPFTFWANLPSMHMSGHAHQLAYVQTIWGDLTDHI
jgi:hypothetical protein